MLKVTILTAIPELKQNEFDNLLQFVSKEKQERIRKYHFFQDARNCLLGDVLSRIEICQASGLCNEQIIFSINDYGKPFLENNNRIHFNISHANNYIVCAVSDEPIGIDIETIKTTDFNFKIAERFFSPDETTYIMADEGITRFFEVWTKKESWIKWKGKGLHIPLNSFCILESSKHGKSSYHKVFQNDEAICHIYSLKNEVPFVRTINTIAFLNNLTL